MKPPSTPGAILNIEEAMELVERAQNDLDRAAQKLSAIRHGSDLCDKAFAMRTAAYKFWSKLSRVAQTRPEMSLDSEPEPRVIAISGAERRNADRIDGYDRDDLGASEDR